MLLAHRRREQAREDYALHMLYLTGLQLFALAGGSDYPVPPPEEALALRPAEHDTAQDVRRRLLQRLQEERSDA